MICDVGPSGRRDIDVADCPEKESRAATDIRRDMCLRDCVVYDGECLERSHNAYSIAAPRGASESAPNAGKSFPLEVVELTRERTSHGIAWTYGVGFFALIVQLGYTAVTARLLDPTAFAAYGIAISVSQLGNYFVGSGVTQAVLQSSAGDDRVSKSATRLVWIAGATVGFLLTIASLVVERLWLIEGLSAMVSILAWSPLLAGLAGVAMASLRREGRFKGPTVMEFCALLLAQSISVGLILLGVGGVGLALSSVMYPLMAALFGWTMLGRVPVPSLRDHAPIKRLSLSISSQNLVHYALYTAPLWTIGTYASADTVGAYNRAQSVATVPLGQLSSAFTRVAYPQIAQSPLGSDGLRRRITGTVSGALVLGLLVFAPIAAARTPIVDLLLGPGWSVAEPLVLAWAAWASLNLAYVASGSALEARGMLKTIWQGQIASILVLSASLPFCFITNAPPAFALSCGIASLAAAYGWQIWTLTAKAMLRIADWVPTFIITAVGFVGLTLIGGALSQMTASQSLFVRLFLVGGVAFASACVLMVISAVMRVQGAVMVLDMVRQVLPGRKRSR